MSKDSDKPHAMQPEDTPELRALYRGFEENHLNPLWTQTANLMPCLLYTSPSPRDRTRSRMPSSA